MNLLYIKELKYIFCGQRKIIEKELLSYHSSIKYFSDFFFVFLKKKLTVKDGCNSQPQHTKNVIDLSATRDVDYKTWIKDLCEFLLNAEGSQETYGDLLPLCLQNVIFNFIIFKLLSLLYL